jgi:MSHA pilin protein MshA
LDHAAGGELAYPAAAGLSDGYDTHVAGVIAVDAQHPDCSLVYAPETGATVIHYDDGSNC